MHFSTLLTSVALAASFVAAHPGHDISQEIREREIALRSLPPNLAHCAEKMRKRGITADAGKRRALLAKYAREERGLDVDAPHIQGRDYTTVLNTDHKSTKGYTPQTSESTIFANTGSCILSPEVTEGPYYVAGEFVRSDIRDGEAGIEFILDTQVLDVSTCEPVTNALVEIWHANSTGVYSGVNVGGNGVGTADSNNIFRPTNRGLQHTDAKGVAQFTTNFPGWYTGRTPHIHVLVHSNAQVTSNGHYTGGTSNHVGQLFFDQKLIAESATVAPYSANKQSLTTNAADGIFKQEAAQGDPVVFYSYLGTSISQGVFGWVAFGVDTTKVTTPRPAASLAATVVVTNAGQQATGVL
ncbi:hypothetical protein V501_04633 [Pseudogymnoascus sp. VKM F-4519 (FW-2642)]|uniref:Intradiol ring-cleavage dioxygenases domain-containing protein n=1 Tax=Pseudogymnoascus verrucosus TaxID=342668 RepID=A0A1B8GQB1_9PEZI|nr:uncharacterized protein VE01_04044 [Pseudogymnoascus verrucosus]KFY74456.1 hypothetical protein V499_05506 [Pseudogymnoascus sp. VKM F-103]KFZ11666.1 hypothetical protein V501_04633 [Pseudogymnoascus sp. VKM F-4519 (FW-2642)]OBT98033.1 hypothetical protein VE01_04044 [Pseudogymnoascus verrucosus]